MKPDTRPLSPHLQIYKLPLTGLMSISHRITGLALVVGTLLVLCWLASAAVGPAAYERTSAFIGSWFGLLLLFGWSIALFYHMCNGIRHMLWDIGCLFEKEEAQKANIVVLAATAGLTVFAWILGLAI